MSEPRPLLYLDSDDLNSKVLAGDSAHRTAKYLQSILTPCQYANFIYWAGELAKEAAGLQDSRKVAESRAQLLADAKKREAIQAEMAALGIPINLKPEPEPKPRAPKPTVDLAGDFGL